MLVRPEHVRPDAEGIALEVKACVYEGERFSLTLALPDGQALKAYGDTAIPVGQKANFAIASAWRL
ncbi:hypothetical protein D9M72_608630 [compost metagenome]